MQTDLEKASISFERRDITSHLPHGVGPIRYLWARLRAIANLVRAQYLKYLP
jgi:hypothetical protein